MLRILCASHQYCVLYIRTRSKSVASAGTDDQVVNGYVSKHTGTTCRHEHNLAQNNMLHSAITQYCKSSSHKTRQWLMNQPCIDLVCVKSRRVSSFIGFLTVICYLLTYDEASNSRMCLQIKCFLKTECWEWLYTVGVDYAEIDGCLKPQVALVSRLAEDWSQRSIEPRVDSQLVHSAAVHIVSKPDTNITGVAQTRSWQTTNTQSCTLCLDLRAALLWIGSPL